MIDGFEFHPEAQAEFVSDVKWYDERDSDLGVRFENAVQRAIIAAMDTPSAWQKWPDWNREPVVYSKRVDEFPYRVVYFVGEQKLIVLAIAHMKREPGYWRNRID